MIPGEFTERAQRLSHGTRARYVGAKCRCTPCRKANSTYVATRTREGDVRKLVDATPARQHLLALSAAGVGRRAVGAACDVSLSIMQGVRSGKRARIRAHLAAKILAVDTQAIADHALIDARPTWVLIRELLAEGYTKLRIARELGQSGPGLQVRRRRILASTALRITKLHARLMGADTEGEDAPTFDDGPRGSILAELYSRRNWITAEALFVAMAVADEDRNARTAMLRRLAKAGEVEVRGEQQPYEYRFPRVVAHTHAEAA